MKDKMKCCALLCLVLVLASTLCYSATLPTANASTSPTELNVTLEKLIGRGQVSQVAWSPDGTYLAAATSVGIYIYGAKTMQELRFIATQATVRAIAFAPASESRSNGSVLASGDMDGTVRLWNAQTGELLRTLHGDRNYVNAVAFTSDGKTLAAGGYSDIIRLWDANSAELVRTLDGHSDQVFGLAFGPDGKMLVSSSSDGTVRSWDLENGNQLWSFGQRTKPTVAIALSPDGRMVAVATAYPGNVYLLDTQTGTVLRALEQGREVGSLAFAPNPKSTLLLAGGDGSKIRIWDVSTGRLVRTLEGHWRGKVSVAYNPDGTRLASGSEDSTLRLWDPSTGQSLHAQELKSNVMGMFNTTTSLLALGGGIERVWLWDAITGDVLQDFKMPSPTLPRFALSADGTILAAATYEGPIWIWSANTGQLLHTLDRPYGPHSIALSTDGRILAAGENNQLSMSDINSGSLIRTIKGDSCGFGSILFSPDGKLLASGGACLPDPSSDMFLRLWNTLTGELVYEMEKDAVPIAFDADGQTLAAAAKNNAIQLWDVRTGKLLRVLERQATRTTIGAFIPFQAKDSTRDKLLALAGWDKTVRLWDTTTGRLLQTLTGHTEGISDVVFSPNGKMLATRSVDGTARLWRITSHE